MAVSAATNTLTSKIIHGAIEVHRAIGPGLLESAYLRCLDCELRSDGMAVGVQVPLPLVYKTIRLECGYRLDLVVERTVIVEVKSVEALAPIHEAQLLRYLRLTGLPVGLLFNFNVPILKNGIRRIINTG
jgi:GxxExxY protein